MKKVLVFIVVLGIIGLLVFIINEETKHTHYFENGLCECGAINEDHIHKYINGLCKCGSTNAEHTHYYVNGVCECGKTNGNHVHNYEDGLCECGAINEDHTHKYVDGICKCGAIYEEHVHNYINDICECGAEKPTEGLIYEMIEGGYALVGYEGAAGKIVIPDKYKGIEVISIKETAFENWSNIYEVSIPNSLREIEGLPFANCKNLKYNMKGDVSYLGNKENPYLLLCNSNLSIYTYSYDIPSGTRFILENAFYKSHYLSSITIPNTVISVGKGAFCDCRSLVNINFESESQLKSIEDSAFGGCYSIKQISLPEGIEEIGSEAFSGCSKLESIILPNSLKYVGTCVFYNCKNLGYNEYNGGYYLGNENNPLLVLASISKNFDGANISNSTKFILEFFCGNENIYNLAWPENMPVIKDFEFQDCINLTAIRIPNSVTSIGDYAFYNCSSLKEITIPDSVTSIGDYAFYNCSGLTYINIPKSVTSIGEDAFNLQNNSAYNPTNIFYNGTIEDWCNISFNNKASNPLYYAKYFKMLNENNEYHKVTEVIIPDSITDIGNYQFYGFEDIINIEIPDSVTSIGDYAFYNCSSLKEITIPDSVTSIGDYAFCNCESLTHINIPESVKSIGKDAFLNCSWLTDVYYNGTIKDWCNISFSSSDSTPMHYADHLYMLDENNEYKDVTEGTEIIIPNSVTCIGSFAFYNFRSLTSIEIPESVRSIGYGAFYKCFSLTNIEIPESVTEIGSYAFGNCESLTSITIPESVTNIGKSVFYMCYDLIVYCEVNSKPSGWSEDWTDDWSDDGSNVLWG